jgi:hypothetical protein
MYTLAQSMPKWAKHAADLVLGGYFFAMRACEFCLTERPGRTRRLTMENVVFRDKDSRLVEQRDPRLREKAMFVTVCFVDQKNGTKMEKRSQRRSGISVLCPVEAWVAVINRVKADTDGLYPRSILEKQQEGWKKLVITLHKTPGW